MKAYRIRRSGGTTTNGIRSIGNRAVETRFFGQSPQQPFFQSATVINKNCEACNAEEQRKVQRKPKTVAEQKGLETDSPVNRKMPSAIDLIFAESAFLQKHAPGAIKKIDVKGKFKIETGEANFKIAYKKCHGFEPDGAIGGFYCRKTDTIHTVAGRGKEHTTILGEAIHEALHKQSKSKMFLNSLELNEGVTQLFTDIILREQKLAPYTGHGYIAETDCALHICRLAGIDAVASAYFRGSVDLLNRLDKIFEAERKRDNAASVVTYTGKDFKKFCEMVKGK